MVQWIEEELATADLGDKRLNTRMGIILNCLANDPAASIPKACRGWSEVQATYRFFNHQSVSGQTVLAPHRDATIKRIQEYEVVLLPQDTTELDCTRPQEVVEGTGPLGCPTHNGLLCHPVIAFTPERVPLGTVDVKIWARDPDDEHKKDRRKQTPFEEKESYRWWEGYQQACAVASLCPNTTIVSISDREGDIYECMMAGERDPQEKKAEWIIRSAQDRRVTGPEDGQYDEIVHQKLRGQVGATAVLGELEVRLPKRASRQARTAKLQLRATRVWLRAPNRKGKRLPSVRVNAVLVREVGAPEGEEPLEWLLLTSLPVDSFDLAHLVVSYYCARWSIEIFFRILKVGCKVEQLQLEKAERLVPCVVMYMIVAWRTMMATMLGRECPELSCEVMFEEQEWKSVYLILHKTEAPVEPPSLGEFVSMLGQLGGHLGRKGDGPPGPEAIWVGLRRMSDFALAWQVFTDRGARAD